MTYHYSAIQNNGEITSSVDAINGETIAYQYDALKRLQSASGKNWGETYVYDGYGNLTQMNPTGTAGAPSLNVSVALDANNVPNNRIVGGGSDANGNQGGGFAGTGLYYDVANRVSEAVNASYQPSYYGYDSDNRRIYYRDVHNNETIYFYGADGKKLATYTYKIITYNGNPEIQATQQSSNVYFAGMMLTAENYGVTTDRLGSVRNIASADYQAQYPYGVEYTLTANDREKYATYTRDSLTGLDYAVNRYYSSQWGRFLSPDPSGGSVGLRNPQSWNRYAYVGNDPANGSDPSGLDGNPFAPGGPPGGPPTSPPAGGMDPFGPDSSSPCQAYMYFVYRNNMGDAENGFYSSNGDWAGYSGALADCEAAYAHAGPYATGTSFLEGAAVGLAAAQITNKPDCAALFQQGDNFVFSNVFGGDPAAYLQGLENNGDIVVSSTFPGTPGTFAGPGVGAVTTPYGGPSFTFLGTPVSTPLITINPSGFFFTGTFNGNPVQNIPGSGFGGLTSLLQVQAAVILHELGHATGVFGPDKGPGVPANQSQQNTATVVSKCFP